MGACGALARFLARHSTAVLVFWLLAAVGCGYLAPQFLSHTVSSFSAPPGTLAHEAEVRYRAAFPAKAQQLRMFVLVERKGGDGGTVLTPEVERFTHEFVREASAFPRVRSVVGFFTFNNTELEPIAPSFVGDGARSTVLAVTYESPNRTDSALVGDVRGAVRRLGPHGYRLGVTGLDALFVDVISQSESDMVRIDVVVLPLALLVLAWYVRSLRLMIVPVVCLITAVVCAFAIMLPVAEHALDVATFTPSVMMSLSLAMTIDYSLFMLSRFGLEVRNGAPPDQAVATTVRRAGEVVLASGTTLTLTFLALALFPLEFLATVGIGSAVALQCTIVVSLTLTPALLRTFPRFFSSFGAPCCKGDGGTEGPGGGEHAYPAAVSSRPSAKQQQQQQQQQRRESSAAPGSISSLALLSPYDYEPEAGDGVGGGAAGADAGRPAGGMLETVSTFCCCPCLRRCRRPLSDREEQYADTLSPRSRRELVRQLDSCWYRSGLNTTRTWAAVGVVVLVLAITVPVALQVLHMRTTIDSEQLFPSNSPALRTYRRMGHDFPPGLLMPYEVLVQPGGGGEPGSVMTGGVFGSIQALVAEMNATGLAAAGNVTSVAYAGGIEVSLDDANAMLGNGTLTNPVLAAFRYAYRYLYAEQTNADASSTIVTVSTSFDPLNEESESWIRDVRALLRNFTARHGGAVQYRLTGGATGALDAVDEIYGLVPRMVGVTMGVVFVAVATMFRSLLVPLRLLVTTTLPITWVYGLAVLIFQRGALDWAFPSLRTSNAIYWLVPVMSFSILVGLALDYDVFLLARVQEFRRSGYTDRASVVKGVYHTGGIITGAGLIMAISFGGLCLSSEMILVQFGAILALGVLLDTFVVRTALVPAILHLGSGRAMWWPGKMPAGFRDELDQADVARVTRRAGRAGSVDSAAAASDGGGTDTEAEHLQYNRPAGRTPRFGRRRAPAASEEEFVYAPLNYGAAPGSFEDGF